MAYRGLAGTSDAVAAAACRLLTVWGWVAQKVQPMYGILLLTLPYCGRVVLGISFDSSALNRAP